MPATDRPPSPTSARLRAQLARVDADLAAARLRLERLEESSGPPGEVEIAVAAAEARIAELEADRAELEGIPGPSERMSAPANDTANDARAVLVATEFLDTKDASAVLGVSVKTLEALRARSDGPPWVKVGRRVRYERARLLEWARRK